ncbi:MAG: hypothetical protein O2955_00265 [Planctomycetota bacterium]|nr:hypothetical protein [Planctomycetota bacterium]
MVYPAVGQGAVGIECREDDQSLRDLLRTITDGPTFHSVLAERQLLNELEAGCHAPVGCWSHFEKDGQHLDAVVLSLDGRERISASAPINGDREKAAEELGRRLAEQLREQGADRLLESTRSPSSDDSN